MWSFITPELPVLDVRRTQEYYRDVLGFQVAWTWEDSYGAVYNGETEIFFAKSDGPRPGAHCYVRVENADEIYARYQKTGATIVEEIESKPWGMREFTIRDLNGHCFRIGHGEKTVHEIAQFRIDG